MICPICFGEATLFFRGYPGYKDPDLFDIARCDACATSFILADGVDTHLIYEAIYRNAEILPGYARYVQYARDILKADSPLDYLAEQEEMYWGVRHYVRTAGLAKGARIIEVGSGLGYLTYALNRDGFDVVGIDVSPTAVEEATRRYGEQYTCADLRSYAELHSEDFDVIILTEVIEHLHDVYGFLNTCLRLLKPGGSIIVTTPNRAAWDSNVVWEVQAPPVHLYWFSNASFEAISAHLSCSLQFVDLSSFPRAWAWRVRRVRGSSPVTKKPRLTRSGDVIENNQPGVVMSILRAGALRCVQVLRRLWRLVGRRPYGPSPTICVVLTKPGKSA